MYIMHGRSFMSERNKIRAGYWRATRQPLSTGLNVGKGDDNICPGDLGKPG